MPTLEPSSVEDISGKTQSSLEMAAKGCARHMKVVDVAYLWLFTSTFRLNDLKLFVNNICISCYLSEHR